MSIFLTLIQIFLSRLFVGETFLSAKIACLATYASHLEDKKEFERAEQYYRKAIQLEPNDYYGHAGIARALIRKKLFNEALYHCNKAISGTDSKMSIASTNILLVVVHESLDQNTLAQQALNQAMAYFGNDPKPTYNELAHTYFSLGFYGRAEHYCGEGIRLFPDSPNFHNNLAIVYAAQHKFGQAKHEWEKVLQLSTDKQLSKYAMKQINRLQGW